MSIRRLFAALFLVAVGFGPAAAAPPARSDVQRIEDAIRGGARPAPRVDVAPKADPAQKTEAPRTDAPVVHLIAVGASNDRDIGAKVGEDAQNVAAVFQASFAAAGKADQLRTRVVVGNETTGRNVLAAVRGLTVRPQDAVVVFYSGHGGIDSRDRHLLTTGAGDVSTQEVLAAAAAHHPRLTVLLTDMCSVRIGQSEGHATLPTGKPRELPCGRVIPWGTVENLFLSHRGVVDLTAAEPGTPSRVDRTGPGSHFTNALIHVLTTPHGAAVAGLDRNGDGALQWAEVLPQLRAVAAARDRASGPAAEPQRAVGRSLGTWAPPADGALTN